MQVNQPDLSSSLVALPAIVRQVWTPKFSMKFVLAKSPWPELGDEWLTAHIILTVSEPNLQTGGDKYRLFFGALWDHYY